jgi:hypothetical protein
MRRILSVALVLVVGGMLASCSTEKTAATAAIQAAETAWTAAKDDVMKILPADAKAVEDAIAGAKASLEQGDAKAALAAAKDLPARIQQLTASLAAKKTELSGTWDAMNAALPGAVTAAQEKVDALAKSRRLPRGLDQATFDSAKASLAEATQAWTDAQAAQQSGNLAEAVAKATQVKDLVTKTLTDLKMPVPATLQS